MNCESISMQKSKILESNQNMGQLFSAVKVCFYCFSLWVFVGVVAFTSFSLATHRNNSKIDDFHQLSLLHWHIIITSTPCGGILNTQRKLMSHATCFVCFKIWGCFKSVIFFHIILMSALCFVFSLDFLPLHISAFWVPIFQFYSTLTKVFLLFSVCFLKKMNQMWSDCLCLPFLPNNLGTSQFHPNLTKGVWSSEKN